MTTRESEDVQEDARKLAEAILASRAQIYAKLAEETDPVVREAILVDELGELQAIVAYLVDLMTKVEAVQYLPMRIPPGGFSA